MTATKKAANSAALVQRPETNVVPHEAPMENIMLAAINQGMTADALKDIMAMQKEMIAHREEREHAQALALVQARMPSIPHNKTVYEKDGVTVRYTYADRDQIMTHVRPILAEHGMSMTYDGKVEGKNVTAFAKLHHGGHSTQSSFTVEIDSKAYMSDQQKVASALSFAMRYAGIMALDITTAGMGNDSGEGLGPAEPVSDEQAANIEALLTEVNAKRDLFFDWCRSALKVRANKVEDIPAKCYEDVITVLEAKRKKG